jgi:hypothetical protein
LVPKSAKPDLDRSQPSPFVIKQVDTTGKKHTLPSQQSFSSLYCPTITQDDEAILLQCCNGGV